MIRKLCLIAICLAAVFALGSCSGIQNPCTDCNPTGNANLSITLADAAPDGVSVITYTLPVVGVSLTNSSGSLVSVYAPSTPAPFELTRLQTDSSLIINNASVASDTYTSLNVTLGASTGILLNASAIAYGTCAAYSVCSLPNAAPYTIAIPISLTLSQNQNKWIGLDLNMANAIVVSGSNVTVDFSQPNVMTATTTPATGNPSSVFETIQDFTGKISTISSSSITVLSGTTGQSLTAVINSSTTVDDPQGYCTGGPSVSCLIGTSAVVSMDTYLNTDGTLTANEIDVLTLNPVVDEFEGMIYPLCQGCNSYGMILSDKTQVSSNTSVASATIGTGVFLTFDPNATYAIDTKTLDVGLNGFTSGSDILPGQVVRINLSSASAHSGGGVDATATRVVLRGSRVSGNVNTVTSPLFTAASLPSYLYVFGGTLGPYPQVQTYSPGTVYQGITQLTQLQPNDPVSIRALYLNTPSPYPFVALKVRKH